MRWSMRNGDACHRPTYFAFVVGDTGRWAFGLTVKGPNVGRGLIIRVYYGPRHWVKVWG